MSPSVINLILKALDANGDAVFSREDIAAWPKGDFDEALRRGLLEEAAPANEVVCPGCEEACLEDVDFIYSDKPGDTRAYVICGQREDIGRVRIPLASLERWAVNTAQLLATVGDSPSSRRAGEFPALFGRDCFDDLGWAVLVWRNGVLPFYWSGRYHPGHFARDAQPPLQRCLVQLDSLGLDALAQRLQSAYDELRAHVEGLDSEYGKHPCPDDASDSSRIVGSALLPSYDKAASFVNLVKEMREAAEAARSQSRKGNREEAKQQDAITIAVAVRDYRVSSRTLRNLVKTGAFHDLRPPGAPENAPLLLSRGEVAGRYPRK